MRRRVAVPFKAGNKLVKTLNDLKEVLENHPENLIPAVQDGRLQRFLKGFGRRFEEIFKEDLTHKEIIEKLGNFLGVEINLEVFLEKREIITETNKLLEAINQKSLIVLGKGTFNAEELELKEPLTLEGQGKNETFIKVKQLIINNPNIVLKDLTLEADEVIFYEPIKKLENAAFYAKQGESFIPKEIFEVQNSNFKIDNLKAEKIIISKTFDDFQLTNATLREILKKSPNLVFKGIKIHIKEDLKIENANIEFKDCEILFYSDSGILAKGGTFIAENSTFRMASGVESYKNITLIESKGYIDKCKFLNLKGGRNLQELDSDFLIKDNFLIGGALVRISNQKRENIFKISRSKFENSSAEVAGGIGTENTLIKLCYFKNCSAKESGGGIVASTCKIEKCIFENCSSEAGGGGIILGNTTLTNCQFEKCSAQTAGGLAIIENSRVENCAFKNCSAQETGGGIMAENSIIEKCIFENCLSEAIGGGALVGDTLIKHCTFKACCTKLFGGGIFAGENSKIEYSKFINCKASEKGSGIYAKSSASLCCNEFENCSSYKESKEDSGGCYITTATFKALKTQNDRCKELELFRWYRDNILLKEPDGKQLIEEYYKTAPLIVEKINSRPDAEEIYKHLWEDYLKVCLEELKRGNYKKVKTLYAEMVSELQKRFL